MAIYDEVDILLSTDGDLNVSANGDLQMAEPSGVVAQDIMFRARTDWDDFDPHPKLGADLQRLIGEPNNKEAGVRAEELFYSSLTKGGRFDPADLRLKAVPVSMERVVLYAFVNALNYDATLITMAVLDYEAGIINTSGGGE